MKKIIKCMIVCIIVLISTKIQRNIYAKDVSKYSNIKPKVIRIEINELDEEKVKEYVPIKTVKIIEREKTWYYFLMNNKVLLIGGVVGLLIIFMIIVMIIAKKNKYRRW